MKGWKDGRMEVWKDGRMEDEKLTDGRIQRREKSRKYGRM